MKSLLLKPTNQLRFGPVSPRCPWKGECHVHGLQGQLITVERNVFLCESMLYQGSKNGSAMSSTTHCYIFCCLYQLEKVVMKHDNSANVSPSLLPAANQDLPQGSLYTPLHSAAIMTPQNSLIL